MRSRLAANSRAATLLSASCAFLCLLLLPFAGPPRVVAGQAPSEMVVVLDYAHGLFPAGARIPLAKVIGGRVGSGSECSGSHLHSDAPGIRICDTGPYPDTEPSGCGHGQLVSLRADLEVLATSRPNVGAAGQSFEIFATVANFGPDDVDVISMAYQIGNGPIGTFPATLSLRAGRRGLVVAEGIVPNDAQPGNIEVRTFVGALPLPSIRTCSGSFVAVPDPDPVDNEHSGSIRVISGAFGRVPGLSTEFRATSPGTKTPIDLQVVSSTTGPLLGVTEQKPGASGHSHSLLCGDRTGGVAPTPFRLDCPDSPDGLRSVFGDFNGDDQADIACPGAAGVRVALGTSSGTAGTPRNFPTGGAPVSLAVGDVNGDGKPDLLSVMGPQGTQPGGISVLLGNGRGSFSAPIPTPFAGNPVAVAVGDFDGDGAADVVVGLDDAMSGVPGSAVPFLGDGAGRFEQMTPVPVGLNPVRIAVGDVNGDGTQDLMVANTGSNDVSVLVGTGTGDFIPSGPYPARNSPSDLGYGDLNANGVIDLVVGSGGSNGASVLLGNGSLEFVDVEVPVDASQFAIAVLDVNGDGRPDIALGTAAANRGSDGPGAIQILVTDSEPVLRPMISGVEVVGRKTLVVTGDGFGAGATILVDGVSQKTVADTATPDTRLTAKKGAKKIASGQTVIVQVVSADGVMSEWFLFTRS